MPQQQNIPAIIAVPFSTLDPTVEHRLRGLVIAAATIQGTNCYLCHDGVFRSSALPLAMQAADREAALEHSESAYFESKDAIAAFCTELGWGVDQKPQLPSEPPRNSVIPISSDTIEINEQAEKALLQKLLTKYGIEP